MFVLGDEVQHVEAWAPLYHEPLVHLPAAFVPQPKQVLILGGGTLFAAAEALKYRSVQRVLVIDHEAGVAKVVARYYTHAKRCFEDSRFELIEGEAYDNFTGLHNQFDLVINDGVDLLERSSPPVRRTTSTTAFANITRCLEAKGVCADVVYRHVFERGRTLQTLKHLRRRYRMALSLVMLPEYHGVLHLLLLWGKASSGISQRLAKVKNQQQMLWCRTPARSPCVYYDPRFLPYYLHLPRQIRDHLALRGRVV